MIKNYTKEDVQDFVEKVISSHIQMSIEDFKNQRSNDFALITADEAVSCAVMAIIKWKSK